jgi:hypothetical protein
MPHRIYYSDKYYDANDYEYRCVPDARCWRWQWPLHLGPIRSSLQRRQLKPPRCALVGDIDRSCRHVILPKDIAKKIQKNKLLAESGARASRLRKLPVASPAPGRTCVLTFPIAGAGRVAGSWRAAVARLGALRDPPARASHPAHAATAHRRYVAVVSPSPTAAAVAHEGACLTAGARRCCVFAGKSYGQ